jgi:hypothetical protein
MRKIAWEKYENYVNKSLAVSKILASGKFFDGGLYNNLDKKDEDEDEDDDGGEGGYMLEFPMTRKIIENIETSINFNCWFGHTNFDIRYSTVKKLKGIQGIELLEIKSRYRFLIGVGKAFDFPDVRKDLENTLGIGK